MLQTIEMSQKEKRSQGFMDESLPKLDESNSEDSLSSSSGTDNKDIQAKL